eukprot:gene6592-1004_t
MAAEYAPPRTHQLWWVTTSTTGTSWQLTMPAVGIALTRMPEK